MNDFVALLIAVVAFCLAFAIIGLSVRGAIAMDVGPYGLAEGNLVQFALAGLAAHRVWRRTRPGSGREDDPLHA